MQFKYDDGAPQNFIVRDDVMSWHEMREKRKIDFVSVDQVPTEEIIDFVKLINKSGQLLFETIEDILEVTDIESGKSRISKEEFNISRYRIILKSS